MRPATEWAMAESELQKLRGSGRTAEKTGLGSGSWPRRAYPTDSGGPEEPQCEGFRTSTSAFS